MTPTAPSPSTPKHLTMHPHVSWRLAKETDETDEAEVETEAKRQPEKTDRASHASQKRGDGVQFHIKYNRESIASYTSGSGLKKRLRRL